MIRKIIIVLLTVAAIELGTIAAMAGLGRTWKQTLWSSGEFPTIGARRVCIITGSAGIVVVTDSEWIGASAVPYQKRSSGTGWLFQRIVQTTERSGVHFRSTNLLLSYIVPLLLAPICAAYPVFAFIRGPLRRYRRRKRGLCVTCGYDLRGSPGRCPECGAGIKMP